MLNLYLLATIFSLTFFAGGHEKSIQSEKPNVLLILVDDLGIKDLGYNGSSFYETPNIDKLASQSFIFTNAYSNSNVCSPSRASILTGQFTARHGITDWIGARSGLAHSRSHPNDKLLPPEYNRALAEREITLAEALQQNGYKTFFAGKWHLGGKGSYPENHGFDVNIGGWEKGSPKGGYFSPWQNPSLPNGPNGQNLSIRLADETIEFIAQNKTEPFFAMLSFYAVHSPIQTTKEKWAKYQAKAEQQGIPKEGFGLEEILPYRLYQDNPIYAGLVETMDEAVGKVLQALEQMNLASRTIVIFTSDNGGVTSGDAYATSNSPYRGGKGYQWEGGTRVPFLIKVPESDVAVENIDFRITGADIFPTVLDLTNLPLIPNQHQDGISLKPLMQEEQIDQRPLYWHYPHYGNQGGEPNSILIEDNWKLIFYWESESSELYNLKADPGETQDLALVEPDRTARMTAQLLEWLNQVEAKTPTIANSYNEAQAKAEKNKRKAQLKLQLEAQRNQMLSPDFKPQSNWYGSD
jgi:arylsulfatase A-like enzyme